MHAASTKAYDRGLVHTGYIIILDCMQLLTCMKVTVAINAATKQSAQAKAALRLELSLGSPFILWYRWTFQSER